MTKTDITEKYSFLIGLKKALKNILFTVVLPGGIYLLTNAEAWLPEGTDAVAVILTSLGTYLIKNYAENK